MTGHRDGSWVGAGDRDYRGGQGNFGCDHMYTVLIMKMVLQCMYMSKAYLIIYNLGMCNYGMLVIDQ